jgi:peptide-methionine (S)-S-oxide reductase
MGACCGTPSSGTTLKTELLPDGSSPATKTSGLEAPKKAGNNKSVNSEVKEVTVSSSSNLACFGAGCYWGTEKYFTTDCPVANAINKKNSKVGFMGPADASKNPSYEDVCTGVTGHVEVYQLEFDGKPETYEELVKFFFRFHDPTTMNKQGNDMGTQYASVIYVYDDIQSEIANRLKDELQSALDCGLVNCFKSKVVSTDVRQATTFYEAKADHQNYLLNNPKGYCNHRIKLKEWPDLKKQAASNSRNGNY